MEKLDKLIREMQKTYPQGIIQDLRKGKELPSVPRFPIASPKLGDVLGDGGFPQGRVTEIYGNEGSGKTTLAYYLAGQIQNSDVKFTDREGKEYYRKGRVAFIDAEHAVDPEFARVQGFDISQSIFVQPDFGEQALDIAIKLADSGEIDFIIIDSVASLTPLAELEGEMGDQQMGLQARMMGKGMRKIVSIANRRNCGVLFINQVREQIGGFSPYGTPTVTPGGKALKFHASIRLEVKRIDWLQDKGEINGIKIKIVGKKNKTAPPMKKQEIDIHFDRGIDSKQEWLDYAVEVGIIEKAGSWFTVHGGERIQGMKNVVAFYSHPENQEIFDKVIEETRKKKFPKMRSNKVVEVKEKTEEEIQNEEKKKKESVETISAIPVEGE